MALGSAELPGWVCSHRRRAAGRDYPGIHLPVKEIGDRSIVELDRVPVQSLADQLDVGDVQEIVGRGDPKSADLGIAQIAQK